MKKSGLKTKSSVIKMSSVVVFSLMLSACGGDQSKQQSDQDNTIEAVKTSCLEDYIDDPCSLVEATYITEISGVNEEQLEVENNAEGRKVSGYVKAECTYKWPSDRKTNMSMSVGDTEINNSIDLKNSIMFGKIDVITEKSYKKTRTSTPEAYFQRVYGVQTKEDKERAKNAIERAKKESEHVDKKSAEALSEMVDKQPDKKEVADIGDKAVTSVFSLKNYDNMRTTHLRVLKDNVVFEVAVDISDDDAADLDVAKRVARRIISGCE